MIDGGLGPAEIAKIRQANRQLWQRSSLARKLVVKRCLLPDGFSKCEQCSEVCAKIAVDHTNKVGAVDGGYLERLWVSSNEMTGLCKKCHDEKTAEERKEEAFKMTFTSIDKDAYGYALDKVEKGLTPKKYDLRMRELMKEYDDTIVPFDPDIAAMEIWAHEKLALQLKRNANKKDFSLDELIGTVIPTPANEALADLF